uniref:Uncharacterized protein n=1 Tax=Corethron hystrix TaxID=216773 RepID=A0A7S1BFZ6_9STRA|mmetsp:Transcript_26585/g.61203  ORF Transcript_26585/g.61203 Transcript_26585/m.61203 type:complete len:357 (+) Transcript_26585:867-1937(+)
MNGQFRENLETILESKHLLQATVYRKILNLKKNRNSEEFGEDLNLFINHQKMNVDDSKADQEVKPGLQTHMQNHLKNIYSEDKTEYQEAEEKSLKAQRNGVGKKETRTQAPQLRADKDNSIRQNFQKDSENSTFKGESYQQDSMQNLKTFSAGDISESAYRNLATFSAGDTSESACRNLATFSADDTQESSCHILTKDYSQENYDLPYLWKITLSKSAIKLGEGLIVLIGLINTCISSFFLENDKDIPATNISNLQDIDLSTISQSEEVYAIANKESSATANEEVYTTVNKNVSSINNEPAVVTTKKGTARYGKNGSVKLVDPFITAIGQNVESFIEYSLSQANRPTIAYWVDRKG